MLDPALTPRTLLDECYTRMSGAILDISKNAHVTN